MYIFIVYTLYVYVIMAKSYTYMYEYDHVHGWKVTQDCTKHLIAMLLNMRCTEAVPAANVCEHQHAK